MGTCLVELNEENNKLNSRVIRYHYIFYSLINYIIAFCESPTSVSLARRLAQRPGSERKNKVRPARLGVYDVFDKYQRLASRSVPFVRYETRVRQHRYHKISQSTRTTLWRREQ